MDQVVFSKDRKAVDTEVDRLKALVELGGFIPCPDHRIPPDAEWDNVLYYNCERMNEAGQGDYCGSDDLLLPATGNGRGGFS
jgi:hypothetical protein